MQLPLKKVCARVVVHGRVQGVFFRAETVAAATREGVRGWVRNRHDGCVEACLSGERDRVEAVIQWCQRGPPAAQVQQVDVMWEEETPDFPDFRVRYD